MRTAEFLRYGTMAEIRAAPVAGRSVTSTPRRPAFATAGIPLPGKRFT